jgi:uncharacterized protein YndB with AHSA1/START domain
MDNKIIVKVLINADSKKVWNYYTIPQHIINWNFAHPSWHCPRAENDMKVGGRYFARMEAKDGSDGFDFIANYIEIDEGKQFSYGFDKRTVTIKINPVKDHTELVVVFDPETENPIDIQRNGWQAILNNFKNYVEIN